MVLKSHGGRARRAGLQSKTEEQNAPVRHETSPPLGPPAPQERIDPPDRPMWPLLTNPSWANLKKLVDILVHPPARFLDAYMGVMVPCVQARPFLLLFCAGLLLFCMYY